MHEHIQCEHEIKYCKVCDVCYCEKCSKQWHSYNITTYSPYITYGDGTIDWQTGTSIIYNGHVHGKDLE
jgi:hypothetical protein